ncbi:response regulator (plasmid) [Ensifer adhaerens]|uniref:response regulator transcription factor n=1 Tax=Ensifer adhaerens TaxID=106592 RepID=UPI0023A9B3EF|nr:response regulator [Ensifer adhaerens]WDZ79336.1 response regulator [Ensifer adhaerens]
MSAYQTTDVRIPTDEMVYIIDDDEQLRASLVDFFQTVGIDSDAFVDTTDFNHRADPERTGCLLLDVRLPGLSGIEFQRRLSAAGSEVPIVFMTGHGDVSMSVSAMKAGAVDFLLKPFCTNDLLMAVNTAITRGREQRELACRRRYVAECAASLTPRERQVMKLVTDGLMNKQVAYELRISEIMVKLHRGSAMRKMQARSLADLVKKVELLQ